MNAHFDFVLFLAGDAKLDFSRERASLVDLETFQIGRTLTHQLTPYSTVLVYTSLSVLKQKGY